MEPTEEDITTFVEAWTKDFGEVLSPDAARYELKRLLDFYLTLAEARLEELDSSNPPRDTMAA